MVSEAATDVAEVMVAISELTPSRAEPSPGFTAAIRGCTAGPPVQAASAMVMIAAAAAATRV